MTCVAISLLVAGAAPLAIVDSSLSLCVVHRAAYSPVEFPPTVVDMRPRIVVALQHSVVPPCVVPV